jgi:hypothetical protein
MLTRWIWCVRAIGWAMLALSVYDIVMRWRIADPEAGYVPPSNDAVPFALLAGIGFELAGKTLAKLGAASRPAP